MPNADWTPDHKRIWGYAGGDDLLARERAREFAAQQGVTLAAQHETHIMEIEPDRMKRGPYKVTIFSVRRQH